MAETGAAALVGISYARSKVMGQVDRDHIQQISFGKSRILQEDEKILLVMNYRIQLPFSIFGLSSIPMESVSMRRAWVGADGGRIAQKAKRKVRIRIRWCISEKTQPDITAILCAIIFTTILKQFRPVR